MNQLHLAETVEEATIALDFDKPLAANDPRWQDLDPARGEAVTRRLETLLTRKPVAEPYHIVLASHRGAGKTSELKRLAHGLEHRYECVYFEANVEMDAFSIEMEDLLLVLARVVEETMRAQGMPLPRELLDKIANWFSETVVTNSLGANYAAEIGAGAEADAAVPFFVRLFARLTALLKVESEHRTAVKSVLRKYPGALLTSVNQLFSEAADRLGEKGRELLLIVDNLDRYDPAVVDALLVRGGDRFRQLHCSFVLTPPISLVYCPESASLDTLFRCHVMPSVRLRARHEPYETLSALGRGSLLDALRKRIRLDVLLPDESSRDRLVLASGGSMRDLLELTQEASLEAKETPITPEMVNLVVQRRRHRMRDRVDANGWWDTLHALAKNQRLSEDRKCLEVLFHRLAFYYVDESGEGWYDIHPLLSELDKFGGRLEAG